MEKAIKERGSCGPQLLLAVSSAAWKGAKGGEPSEDSKAAAGEKKVFTESLASCFAAARWIALGSQEHTICWPADAVNRQLFHRPTNLVFVLSCSHMFSIIEFCP